MRGRRDRGSGASGERFGTRNLQVFLLPLGERPPADGIRRSAYAGSSTVPETRDGQTPGGTPSIRTTWDSDPERWMGATR